MAHHQQRLQTKQAITNYQLIILFEFRIYIYYNVFSTPPVLASLRTFVRALGFNIIAAVGGSALLLLVVGSICSKIVLVFAKCLSNVYLMKNVATEKWKLLFCTLKTTDKENSEEKCAIPPQKCFIYSICLLSTRRTLI